MGYLHSVPYMVVVHFFTGLHNGVLLAIAVGGLVGVIVVGLAVIVLVDQVFRCTFKKDYKIQNASRIEPRSRETNPDSYHKQLGSSVFVNPITQGNTTLHFENLV